MVGNRSRKNNVRVGVMTRSRTRAPIMGMGRWITPPSNPPPIIENRWRKAILKFNSPAAGDSGSIEDVTPARVFELLKSQQGLDVTAALSKCRFLQIKSYSLPGVADSGGQTYPTTKMEIYTPEESATQGVLLAQREDSGTLDSPARIGYTFAEPLAARVLAGSSTAYVARVESYHCARVLVYITVMWCTVPN